MGRAGKIAAHVLLAFLAFVVGRILAGVTLFDIPTLIQGALFAASTLMVELVLRVERAPWRFVAAADILRLARSTLTACVVYGVLSLLIFSRFEGVRGLIGTFVIQVFLLASLRVVRRGLHEGVLFESVLRLRPAAAHPSLPNLLIVGSASQAEDFLRAPAGLGERYNTVGVVSPLEKETGDELRGVCVLGAIEAFDTVLGQLREGGLSPSAILFLADSPMSAFGAERLGRLKTEGVRLLRRHGVVEMGHAAVGALREISLEELLSRPPVRLDPEPVRALVSGRRVLVTGAGGSIGSELCRQIAASGCAQLVMLDTSEANLFHIDREIGEAWPGLARRDVLCDVRDASRVDRVFAAERPEIVFHAAALKHVTLVEHHPCEGARTNILGTRNVAAAARAFGAAHMALISTDKAVAPTSVMGATKRVAESIARQYGSSHETRVSIVRFGNVLGSAGSVVPIFQHQIARGGPITLTDAAVERFFMTIPEAVQLVLRAVALSAASPEPPAGVLTLEMGEPVKIGDLARRMIELQGLVPDRDIEIRVTGLRPGEKLTEELVDVNEAARPKAAGVIEAAPHTPPPTIEADRLVELEASALAGDEFGVRTQVFAMVERIRGAEIARPTKARTRA